MRCRFLAPFLLTVLVLVSSGCMGTGTWTQEATIANGEKFEIPLGKGGVPRTEDSKIRVEYAGMTPDVKNQLACISAKLFFKKDLHVKSILMQDISDDPVLNIIYDEHPQLKDGYWSSSSAYRPLTAPEFKWLLLIDNSFRVYQFTIVTEDGQTLVYRQASLYNQYMKQAIRMGMGLKD